MDNYRLGIFMVLEPIFYGACCRYTGSCCSMLRRWKFWRTVFMVSRFRLSLVIGNRQAKHLYAGNQGDFQYEKDSLLHGVGSNYDQLQLGYFYLGGRSWTHCRNKHGLLYQPADECTLWCSISA